MKTLLNLIGLSLILTFTSCHNTNPGPPVYDPADIQKDVRHFMSYVVSDIRLYQNFTAYDTLDKSMDKLSFLKALTSGNYFPLKLQSGGGKLYYQLYKFKPSAGDDMRALITGYAPAYYDHYRRVGRKFPAFDFTDINGNRYTTQSTKGKIVILKCWFIGCTNCELEMPELNALVNKYKNRKDVIFVSLAPDTKTQLQAFLKRKRFDYSIIPGQKAYMADVLKMNAFPTHFIINKQGTVVNVVETPEEIQYSLDNDL
jgi:peroxiredoxin